MRDEAQQSIRVWDLPTRVFHWCLALCVLGLLITGKIGGEAMIWHARLGYAVATLLLFRLAWGFVGGYWSRFRAFSYSPMQFMNHVRGNLGPSTLLGHSPLGAGSVFAMLVFLALQVATGLFSDDGADFSGPLNILVSNQTADRLTDYHEDVGQFILIALVVLHVLAIAYYHLRKGQNLTGPMLHGDKQVAFDAPASRDDARSRLLALLLIGLCGGLVAWVVSLGTQ